MKLKLIIFLSINLAIALLAAVASPALISGPEYRRYKVAFDYVEQLQPGERVDVILGDSRPECCIDAGALGFVNLSLAGGTPVEGYYQLRQILDQGADVGRVIVSYGPNHIFSQDTYYSRAQYFGLIDDEFLKSVDDLAVSLEDAEYQRYQWRAVEVVDEYLPFLSVDHKFAIVNVLSMDQTVAGVIDGLKERITGESLAEEDDPVHIKLHSIIASERVNRRDKQPPEYALQEARSPVNEHFLNEIFRLAAERDIDVYYLVMPFNTGVELPDETFYRRFSDVLASSGFQQCSSEFRFWPNEHFYDPSHLNAPGSRRLAEELRTGLPFCDGTGNVGVAAHQVQESEGAAEAQSLQ